jgi:drug/metabolite transporter (DMT)-like permease
MVFLGEALQGFHAAGFITIVAGVVLATYRRG